MTKKGGALPEILEKWEKRQEKLKEKELSNIATVKQRNSDISLLTAQGGPFTKEEQVQQYLEDTSVPDSVKNKRMYLEVRFFFHPTIFTLKLNKQYFL